jgi:hypothetical protein
METDKPNKTRSRRKQVLVVDAAETPLSTTSVLKARLLATTERGSARAVVLETIDADDNEVLPAVIKLNKLVAGFVKSVALNSARVFYRDNYTCQYCNTRKPQRELTLDHVFPKSRGGKDTWENLTTACKKCNNKKADRTPEEAGMTLLSTPTKPRDSLVFEIMVRSEPHLLQAWVRYLRQLDMEELRGSGLECVAEELAS